MLICCALRVVTFDDTHHAEVCANNIARCFNFAFCNQNKWCGVLWQSGSQVRINLKFCYRRGDRDIYNPSPEIDTHRCSLQITNYLQDSTSTNLSRSLQSEKRVMFSFLGYSPKRKLILHGMFTSYRSYVMNRATTHNEYTGRLRFTSSRPKDNM